MKLKLIVFDLDGVLINSLPNMIYSWNKVRRKFKIDNKIFYSNPLKIFDFKKDVIIKNSQNSQQNIYSQNPSFQNQNNNEKLFYTNQEVSNNFNTNIFVRTDNVPQSKNKIKFI